MLDPAVLHRIVKAYDVRGLVDGELTSDVARALGAAAAQVLVEPGQELVIGHDMRPSSPVLVDAFADGVQSEGVDVVDLGLVSTDGLYYASGILDAPGAMFTASHNPAEYNGVKLCRAGAAPVSIDTGLARIRDLALAHGRERDGGSGDARGGRRRLDLAESFAEHVRSFIDIHAVDGMRIVVDAGNGMAGHVWPTVAEGLGITTVPLYFELDGTFPNHPANPLDPANLVDLSAAVVAEGAVLGLAFDGDADRVFAVDAQGRPVDSSLVGALVAARLLGRESGATVIHNLICSRSVAEAILVAGGVPFRSRVGHSFIKADMAASGAVLGVEHSGHFYFRDNFRADSGMIAAVVLLEAVALAGGSLSSAVAPHDRYVRSGERNFEVADATAALEHVAADFAGHPQDRLDGLTVDLGESWFNLRPSNTEPLLRLNVEAADPPLLERTLGSVIAALRSSAAGGSATPPSDEKGE
jgi:phosphomannomutase